MGAISFWDLPPDTAGTGAILGGVGESELSLILPRFGSTEGETFSSHPHDLVTFKAGAVVFRLPGISKPHGFVQLGIDNKKSGNSDGSDVTITGYKPSPFEIICTIWTQPQWDALCDVVAKLWAIPKKRTKLSRIAVDVDHPDLQFANVHSVGITGIGFPEEGKIPQSRMVRFRVIENVPRGGKDPTQTLGGKGPGVIDEFALTDGQKAGFKNAGPERPSANLRPGGPPASPTGGVE